MKKIISLCLVILVSVTGISCNKKEDKSIPTTVLVAMVTDYGDITDMSFNQSTWEAILEFSKKYNVGVKYYKPSGDSTAERVAAVEKAIADGAKIIVLPGYAFGGTLVEVSEKYPNVKFIAIDVSKGDILEAGVPKKGKKYDYTPSNWKVEEYCHMDNIYCAVFKEEIAGFLAGYVAVKLGYRQLGFLGGMAVPAVVRYGYGFVQGIERAAIEFGIDNIVVKYAYGNQFYGDADITAAMDAWFAGGTEIIFPCGGGIYTSIAEAASKKGVNGKLIGVDVDQAPIIDQKYGKLTVTSAMKGLYPATYHALEDIVINGNWSNYAGKIDTLGLVSSEDIEKNYVGLPLESTQWEEGKWTLKDYKELVAKLYSGELKVDSDISKMPTTKKVKVIYLGNIK